jgi:hypothetical protein
VACSEARHIRKYGISDGYHLLSERLRQELEDHYRQTEYGKRVDWRVPEHSGNLTDWGHWSMALLVEKLTAEGVRCNWEER